MLSLPVYRSLQGRIKWLPAVTYGEFAEQLKVGMAKVGRRFGLPFFSTWDLRLAK